ncbi:alginate lyase family protein [Aquitalea sp. LB_tupeE]|uniref:alginate lyase family protein n=1 Tax=Aquitalea sp. LB_tupeE TaxID=2748078 RepID=UPI0015C10A9F|nr:alginate lyase family protein [Aquitalea sp. LB_tupeE]NWK78981.1 alginate lyase family protein [Aquitalea sp. LB_tupeE]
MLTNWRSLPISLSMLLCWLAGTSMAIASQPAPWCMAGNAAPSLLHRAEAALKQAPSPLPQIHTEGTLPHQGIFDQSVKAKQDWFRMRDLALAWRGTGDSRYLDGVARQLDAWTPVYQPSFNPIDETDLEALIDAYAITANQLPAATASQTRQLLRQLAEGYIWRIRTASQPLGATFKNNWNSHRIKLITLSALALQDASLQKTAGELFRQHLERNINAQGETLDYRERDALHYVTYDLEPLVRAAIAARQWQQDWLHDKAPSGGSLQLALNWLRPYAEGQLQHQEFVHSQVRFDFVRREAGLPGYAGNWQANTSRKLYALASRLSPDYDSTLLTGPQLPDWIQQCWPGGPDDTSSK